MVYFTIEVLPSCGFTDRLLQFSSFYKLGLSLNYRYIHTPFVSLRSSQNIYNFLGFNAYFYFRISDIDPQQYWIERLEIGDRMLQDQQIEDLEGLQNWIDRTVLNLLQSHPKIILIFQLVGNRFFFGTIHSKIRDFQDRLDLRSIYFATQKKTTSTLNRASCLKP